MPATRGGRFAPPPLTDLVISRSRLFTRLSTRPVVVVAAAAGYGKSLLLASWLAEDPPVGSVGWLSLDPADEDPGRLAADLLACLRSPCTGSTGDAIQRLEAPPAFADHLAFVDALHQALLDEEEPLTLVLDDVQHLSGSPRALAMVDRFIAWAPASTRIVVASRAMPPLRLQRLHLADRLELIEHADLAFTPEETAVAVGAWGLGLGPDAVSDLHNLTQGWPAATRLAVLAVRAGNRRDLPVAVGRDDALADYLTAEVVSALDPELRDFVVEGTIDDVVCSSLLDAVRQRTDSAVLLERCVTQGLFLTRESGTTDEQWFRWHGLLASHVRRLPPHGRDVGTAAQRRAALWWRAVDPEVAVMHALAAKDDELAGDIAAVGVAGPRPLRPRGNRSTDGDGGAGRVSARRPSCTWPRRSSRRSRPRSTSPVPSFRQPGRSRSSSGFGARPVRDAGHGRRAVRGARPGRSGGVAVAGPPPARGCPGGRNPAHPGHAGPGQTPRRHERGPAARPPTGGTAPAARSQRHRHRAGVRVARDRGQGRDVRADDRDRPPRPGPRPWPKASWRRPVQRGGATCRAPRWRTASSDGSRCGRASRNVRSSCSTGVRPPCCRTTGECADW